MNILCIDDDEGLLFLMRSTLEDETNQVTTCQDSHAAVATLHATSFDIVILDNEMPGMNGLEIIKQCQSLPQIPPIIMVTGAGNETTAVEAMRLGASDYVVKDINLGYLKILPTVIRQVIKERELRAKQQAAERLAAAEQERSRLLNQFILDASHEFRIPLTVIQSSGELLERLTDNPKHQTYITRILQQSDRILSLVDHLIQLSLLENSAQLPLLPTDLRTCINDALAYGHTIIESMQLEVDLRLPAQAVQVAASPYELTQAFIELLSNAYKASPKGAQLSIRVQTNDDIVITEICDYGQGMTEDQRHRIFERFYRVDEAHTTPGFGLGLPIVARIIALHNGTIAVTSAVGQGTNVTITLPRLQST